MRLSKPVNKPTWERTVNGDYWPQRDQVCHRVAYDFAGVSQAIKRCRKLDLVIQAGGNVGAWPKHLITIFKEVYTFEPSTENFELMEENLRGLPVKLFHAALGKDSGRCTVKLNPNNCGDDQTIPGNDVDVVSIDSLGVDPDLIYLDIQGDEYPALLGARETLARCSPIVGIEVDNKLARLKGDAVGLLGELGYTQFAKHRQDFLFERVI